MIRLVLLSILLLLSLLAIFKAPSYHSWLSAVLISEFPLVFAGVTMLVLLAGVWTAQYQQAGTIAGVLAILVFLSPVVRAYILSRNLEQQLSTALNIETRTDQKIFSVLGMLTGSNQSKGVYERFNYCSYSGKDLALDFYRTAFAGKRPCVIVVHGGSWKSGDSKQLPELNTVLADAGYHVASINYRLAPQYKSPMPVQDVAAAMNYLRQHASELNIDTDNFVLLGRSAGAQIALLAAYTLNETGLKGVIDFYGPADMVWGYAAPARPLVMNSRKVMQDYLGGSYDDVPHNYLASSPLNFVNKSSVPTLIIHGENDVLVSYEHSTRLKKKLDENGIKNYLLSLPWATHAFDYTLTGPGGQLSTYAVKRFLTAVTKPQEQ